MFERYTERGRRAIFFARYESSLFGSREIKAEELLLGILREDKPLAMRLDNGAAETIRRELEMLAPPKAERIATSVDLPLSFESKRALAYAAEEAERLNHKHIDAVHLMLGLLRVESSLAAKLLLKHGMTLEQCREIAASQAPPEVPVAGAAVSFERPHIPPVAPPKTSLEPAIDDLRQLIENTYARLRVHADPYGGRTRKEALGHLTDWAIVHHQWVIQAVMESSVKATGYPDEAAAAVQHYADFPWEDAVDLWASLNRLLIHVLERIPEDKLAVPCRIGSAEPVPLAKMIQAYVQHCRDLVGRIQQE